MLEELTIIPLGGLCNRIRAIACARRICSMVNAKCRVVWEWGEYSDYFLPENDFNVIPCATPQILDGAEVIIHRKETLGGNYNERLVDVQKRAKLAIISGHRFSILGEGKKLSERNLRSWLIRPSSVVKECIKEFIKSRFHEKIVGVHVRRTDNIRAILQTPDSLYVQRMHLLAEQGYKFFFASDNKATYENFRAIFGDRLICYPKVDASADRWPRKFIHTALFEDLVDLHLLASCEFVIGSAASSYSRFAILYNRSQKCELLSLKEGPETTGQTHTDDQRAK